jgi:hypothetical protein
VRERLREDDPGGGERGWSDTEGADGIEGDGTEGEAQRSAGTGTEEEWGRYVSKRGRGVEPRVMFLLSRFVFVVLILRGRTGSRT